MEKVEPRGYFVQDLITDLRDGEVLHVLLMALFGPGTPAHSDFAELPPLPPPPKGGGALSGSGAAALRQSAVKQQLVWLQKAFGPAAGLDVVYFSLASSSSFNDSQAPFPSTAASSFSAASPSSELGALELEESDAEDALPDSDGAVPESSTAGGGTKASSPTVIGTGKAASDAAAATEKMLDGLAFAISSGSDGAATVGVVWACAQCWCARGCLASRAPSYAACLAPQLPPPSPSSSNIVPTSGTHDGLKEWLLAYFAALASIGARVPLSSPVVLAPSASSSKSVGSAAASLEDVDIQSGGAADSSSGGDGSSTGAAAADQSYSSGANCPGKHGLSTFKTTNNSWWCRSVHVCSTVPSV